VWERDTIAMVEAAAASAEKDGSRGALLGLKRAWPTSVGCGHCRTEAEEEGGAVAGEQDGTTGAAVEEEMAASWEGSIAERRRGVLVYLGL
jgi:hypothetical protein